MSKIELRREIYNKYTDFIVVCIGMVFQAIHFYSDKNIHIKEGKCPQPVPLEVEPRKLSWRNRSQGRVPRSNQRRRSELEENRSLSPHPVIRL